MKNLFYIPALGGLTSVAFIGDNKEFETDLLDTEVCSLFSFAKIIGAATLTQLNEDGDIISTKKI